MVVLYTGGEVCGAVYLRHTTVIRMIGITQHCIHIVHFAQLLEERYQIQKLRVAHVVEPRRHRHSVVWMEYVGSGRIVHDHDLLQLPPQLVQVLHVVTPVEDAALPEEARPEDAPLVQQVGHGIGVLGQRRREQHALVQLAHPPQEVVHVRPLQHVHLVNRPVDLDGHHEVGVANRLKHHVFSGIFTKLHDRFDDTYRCRIPHSTHLQTAILNPGRNGIWKIILPKMARASFNHPVGSSAGF
jgi:hypothetical protein